MVSEQTGNRHVGMCVPKLSAFLLYLNSQFASRSKDKCDRSVSRSQKRLTAQLVRVGDGEDETTHALI